MRRTFALLLVMLFVCAGAGAQPKDALDAAMERLSVMSQREEAFEGIRYNNGHLSARGCQPLSMANAVIASFGVEDREAAIELVKETTQVLVPKRVRGKGRMELTRTPLLLSTEARQAEAQAYPHLAELIGLSASEITVLEGHLDAQIVAEHFGGRQTPAMLVGRQTVYPEWEQMMEIISCLSDMGLSDATLCLASVSVGRKDSGAPLGSGKNGHYVSVFIHVSTFMEEGRIYVLDSLPRAIEGEESGFTTEMHEAYPFVQKNSAFSSAFDATRVRHTVLRLTQRETDGWKEAVPKEKAKRMKPLLLFGPGVLMIHAPARAD